METIEKYITLVRYLKKKIQNEHISYDEVSAFATDIAKEIDRCMVNKEPSVVWERLYEEVLWLKLELQNNE